MPLTLTLCLTQNCNLRCRYCYAGRKRPCTMSRETAERAMDIGIAEAQQRGESVDLSFFGGEPLLEWELLQHCYAYLAERGKELVSPPRFGITTNGTLLTEEKAAWLVEKNFLIGLSADGSPAMHDTNRRYADGRPSSPEVTRALELLEGHPRARRKIICVVNPQNVGMLAEGVAWLGERTSAPIGLNLDFWHEWSDAEFDIFAEQLTAVQQMMLASYRDGTRPLHVDNIEGKIHSHLNGKGCGRCRIGEQELAVSTEGTFFPCSRLVGETQNPLFAIGNVTDGIDRAKQNFLIATRGNATPACKLCGLRTRCMNGCGCTNFAASGHINQVSPFLCSSERLFIRLADELAETLYAERNPAFLKTFYGRSDK